MNDQYEPAPPPPPPTSKSNANTIAIIVILVVVGLFGLCVCGGVAAIMLPALNHARRAAQQVVDTTHIRAITQGLTVYAMDNNGQFPDHAGKLLAGGMVTAEQFMNPSHTTTPPAHAGGPAPSAYYTFGDYHFVYLPEDADTLHGDAILLFGRNVDGSGRSVGFGDGRAQFVPDAEFTQLVRDANARRAGMGKPPIDPNALGDFAP